MTATQAQLGFGVLFKLRTATGPDVYTTVGQQQFKNPYAVKVDAIDATHEESDGAFKEFIPGLKEAGDIELTIHYLPASTTESLIMSGLGATQVCRSVFPSGAYVQYSAFVTDFQPETPIDGKMTATLKLKISGQMTIQAASAPTNSRLPSIAGSDGTPSSGDTLTAVDGIWANEPTSYTYQWKKDTVNIVGATAKTYTVVAGDSTHAITVAVTATNSAGSATATSIPATIS